MIQLECQFSEDLNIRDNIESSPKKNGSSSDLVPYLEELGVRIIEKHQPILFFPNSNELVHRWSAYVQGFSANFVQNTISKYKANYVSPIVFDPFAGSGIALVQAKLNGYKYFQMNVGE